MSFYLPFICDGLRKSDSVVILCAGPSLFSNKEKIVNYIKKNGSIVFSANYNYEEFGIKSDYTYITDQYKLIENLSKINSDLIVPVCMKTDCDKHTLKRHLKDHGGIVKNLLREKFDFSKYKLYRVGKKNKISVYGEMGTLRMLSNGEFPYSRLGSAGQGSIMSSLVYRPKRMLIVGLDGAGKNGKSFSKKLYNGEVVKYDRDKSVRITQYIEKKLIPFIKSRGVTIETFDDVLFNGIDKKRFGIEII